VDSTIDAMLVEVVEDALPEDLFEGRLAGLDAPAQALPRVPVVVLDHHDRESAHGVRHFRSQCLAQRREPKAAIAVAREDAGPREHAEDAVQAARIDPDVSREVRRGTRPRGEAVGDAELGEDEDGARYPVSGDELEHRHRWRQRGGVGIQEESPSLGWSYLARLG